MNKKKAYVVGTKVSKSLSPLIFNHWFGKYGINACIIVPSSGIENVVDKVCLYQISSFGLNYFQHIAK